MSDYPTRYTVDCCEPKLCWARECMWAGEDKGSFTPGRGYTSYYDKPLPVCTTRHLHGCPYPKPDMDPENARCCFRPDYHNVQRNRKAVPCRTCGATAPGWAAKILRELPTLPGVHCRHENQESDMVKGWVECTDCRGHWKDRRRVPPFETPTHTLEDMLNALEAVYSAITLVNSPLK